MATRSGKAKSMEDTWNEKELAKHVLKDKKKASDGSPKSSPKVSRGRPTASSVASSSLSSTAPAGPISSSSGRGKEKLSSTTMAVSNGHSSNREGRGDRERRGRPARREEVAILREKEKSSASPKSGERTRSSGRIQATRDQRERAGQGKDDKRSSEKAVRRDGRGGREHGSRSRKEGERREQHEISTRAREGREERGEGHEISRRVREGRKERGEGHEISRRVREGRKERGEGHDTTGRGRERERREQRETSGQVKEGRSKQRLETVASSRPRNEREIHVQQTEHQKLSKSISSRQRLPEGAIPQPMVEVQAEEENGEAVEEDFVYEEEFEEDDDYNDDDFEEDIEEESETKSGSDDGLPPTTNPDPSSGINLVEIMQALDAENKDLLVGKEEAFPAIKPQSEPTPSLVSASASRGSVGSQGSMGSRRSMTQRRKFVDFSSAKKKEEQERVAHITRKRGQELLSMIELDVVAFDLFDLLPLSEYEVYMHSFGVEGTRQVACQTGEDNAHIEVQTDTTETREKWVQWPPEDLKGYGGPTDEEEEAAVTMAAGGAVRLTSFLKRASQVMAVLLEENATPSGQSPFHSNQSQIPFCTSGMTIRPPEQLQGCTLTSMEYSPAHPHLVMTTHTPTTEVCQDPVPRGGGAVCVWSTREPSQPLHVLVCESGPECGCFSCHKTTLVLTGNRDGTVALWDLREPVAMHTRPPGAATPTNDLLIPRFPTFSTAALSHKHNHHAPIVTITSITTSTLHTPPPLTDNTETETIGLSFQLASLDRDGMLIIWVAVETKPHPQGSESDLGLVPDGRVMLVWSTVLDTVRSLSPSSIPVQTFCVQFHPTDTNHLFVGTDEGTVVHQTRYGRRPIPRQYWSQPESHCPCDITSLNFSPWQPDHFLAGSSNGCIALFHTKKEKPLATWSESTNGIAVRRIEWAWHHPGMFMVLAADSTLYLWSLLDRDDGPMQVYRAEDKTSAIVSFRLSPSSSSLSSSLALCLSDSTLAIHQLSTTQQPATLATSTVDGSNSNQTQLLPNFINYLQTL